MHQLFIDFKKAYDSVRREVLYNILIQFGIPMKLVRLITMFGSFHTVVLLSQISIMTVNHNNALY